MTGVYKVEYPPPPTGKEGIKSKALEIGKKVKGWKRRKSKVFEDFTLLTVPKDSI